MNQPIRVVLDPRAELDGTEAVFQGPGRTVWVVAEATGADKDQTTVAGGAEIDLGELLEKLFDSGCIGVLVEGGPRTIRRFFDARMVDSLELFVGPCFFGSGAPFLGPTGPTASLSLERVSKLGPDARLTFRVQPFLKVD